MAGLEKFTLKEMKNVSKESYREQKIRSYKNFVDSSRTKENYTYNYGSSAEMLKAMKKRMIDILNGEDPKVNTKIGSWVVTCPEELKDNPKLVHLFFDTTKEFLENRYGKENVIDVVVHMDETTPHCTAYIVPEAISRKNGKKTVSTASCFTRKDLQTFHSDFDKYCESIFGKSGLVKNGNTKDAKDMKDLKKKTFQKLQQENERLSAIVEEQKEQIQALQEQVEELQSMLPKAHKRTDDKKVTVSPQPKSVTPRQPSIDDLLFSYCYAEKSNNSETMIHQKKMFKRYYPDQDFKVCLHDYKQKQQQQKQQRILTEIVIDNNPKHQKDTGLSL